MNGQDYMGVNDIYNTQMRANNIVIGIFSRFNEKLLRMNGKTLFLTVND